MSRARAWLGLAAGLGMVAALLLVPLPPAAEGSLRNAVLDALHVPLFFGLMLALRSGSRLQPRWAFAAGLALILGAEGLQPWVGRSFSWWDVALGLLGLMAGMVWSGTVRHRRFWVLLLLLLGFSPLGALCLDRWIIYRAFPTLASFDLPWEAYRLDPRGARLARVGGEGGGAVLEVSRKEVGEVYVGFAMQRIPRNWGRVHALRLVLENPQPRTLPVVVRVDDRRTFMPAYAERYQGEFAMPPGRFVLEIPREDLGLASGGGPMDLTRVARLVVFFPDIQLGETVRVARIGLTLNPEPAAP